MVLGGILCLERAFNMGLSYTAAGGPQWDTWAKRFLLYEFMSYMVRRWPFLSGVTLFKRRRSEALFC